MRASHGLGPVNRGTSGQADRATRIVVAIATTGRAPVVAQALERLERQRRSPDRFIVVGAGDADLAGLEPGEALLLATAEKGLCRQRNRALELIGDSADVVVFLDDDFVPAAGFLDGIERLFVEAPEVAAATGLVIADGINSAGLSFAAADALVAAYDAAPRAPDRTRDTFAAYGCNMAYRVAAARGLNFDENLPLYGWQEDTDFSAAVARRGRLVETNLFAGVHLGVKSGRTSGRRLGYSQVVNPLYIAAKGNFAWRRAVAMVARNLAANVVRSIAPEPYIDRRGRLIGNLIALGELVRGRAHPVRVLGLPG